MTTDVASDGRQGLRVATWNLERVRPHGWKIAPAQRRRMAAVAADIWVLTETHVDMAPTEHHVYSAFSPPHPERRPDDERWTAIWSRWPLKVVDDPAPHRRGTIAAIVETPLTPLIVYGTVIAWANEPAFDDGRRARMWEVHLAEIARQGREWRTLRSRYPELPLVVAGDFNQDRDGSGWYGTRATRTKLTTELEAAKLTCVSGIDVVEAGLLEGCHLIDHICVDGDIACRTSLSCWEPHHGELRLSDHPAVAVDLS